MAKMPMYTLKYVKAEGCWNVYDKKGKEVGCYDNKSQAMKGGVLKRLVGKAGGVVKIMGKNGKGVGQRAYPAR
jgi:hypothetical protein